MSAQTPSTRRLAIAIGAATASATIAVGVTVASLLGWFTPSPAMPGPDPISILVPVSSTLVPQPTTSAIDDVQRAHDDDDDDDHEHGHGQEEEGDDDD